MALGNSLEAMTLRNKTVVGARTSTKPVRSKKKQIQAAESQHHDGKDAKAVVLENDFMGSSRSIYNRFFWYLNNKHLENAESLNKADCYNLLAHVSGQLFLTLYITLQSDFKGALFNWFRPKHDEIYAKCKTLYNKDACNSLDNLVINYDLVRVFGKIEQQLRLSPEYFSITQAQEVMVEALCVMHEALIKIMRKPLYLYDYSLDDTGEVNEDIELDEEDKALIGGDWKNPIPAAMTEPVRAGYRHFIKFVRLYEEAATVDQQDIRFDVIASMMFIIRDMVVKILEPQFCDGVYRFGWGDQPSEFVDKYYDLFAALLDDESHGLLGKGLRDCYVHMHDAKKSQAQETAEEIYKNNIRTFSRINMVSGSARTTLPDYLDEDSYRYHDQNGLLECASSNLMSWVVTLDQTGEVVTTLLDRGVQVRIEDIQKVLEKPLSELRAVRTLLFQRVPRTNIIQAMQKSMSGDIGWTDHMMQQLIDYIPEQWKLFDCIANLLNRKGHCVQEILNSSKADIRARIHPAMKRSNNNPVTLLGRTVENIIKRNKAKVDEKEYKNINAHIDANMLIFLRDSDVKYVPPGDNKQFESMSIDDADVTMWKTLFQAATYRCASLKHPNYLDCIMMRALPTADDLLDYLAFLYDTYGKEIMEQMFFHNGVVDQNINWVVIRQDGGAPTLISLVEQIKEQNKTTVQEEAAARDGFILSFLMRMRIVPGPTKSTDALFEYHQEMIADLEKECEASHTNYIASIITTAKDTMQQIGRQQGYGCYTVLFQ